MMDFKTPSRGEPDYIPRSQHPVPIATVPPPAPKPEPATQEHHAPRKKKSKKAKSKIWLKVVIILLVLGLIGWLAYGYITTKNQLTKASNTTKSGGNSETADLVNKVGLLVYLPTGETPTIATVNDASKLKNQAFFANAQNGDKVLIYSKAGKAVIYRPSANRVVQFSTVNLSGSAATP